MKPHHYLLLICFAVMLPCGVAWGETHTNYKEVFTASEVNIRTEPNMSSKVIIKIPKNTPIHINDENENWYKVCINDEYNGWVLKRYISVPQNSLDSKGRSILDLITYAKTFLNTRYSYGGTSIQGFDCSGFTRYVYEKFGYRLPHNAEAQMNLGTPVSKDSLAPGDLVFFITLNSKQVNHVGIYIGDDCFIHAASGYGAVRISSLSEGYYKQRYIGAKRIF